MGIYRNIQLTFWTDPKVADEFTPEDKYFYLYLFTNPHTNLCGCYELSKRQAAWETGYSLETITRLLERFENVHKVIATDPETKEILLFNYHKYNWTKSGDFKKGVIKNINAVKSDSFREYLTALLDGVETVSRPSRDGRGTSVSVDTVSVNTVSESINTVNNVNNLNNKPKSKNNNKSINKDIQGQTFGEYNNVILTQEEREKLIAEYGEYMTEQAIAYLDEYIEEKGYKSKKHYLAIKRWALNAAREQINRKTAAEKTGGATNKTAQELNDFYRMAQEWAESGA